MDLFHKTYEAQNTQLVINFRLTVFKFTVALTQLLVSTVKPHSHLFPLEYSGNDTLGGHSESSVVDDGHSECGQLALVTHRRIRTNALQSSRLYLKNPKCIVIFQVLSGVVHKILERASSYIRDNAETSKFLVDFLSIIYKLASIQTIEKTLQSQISINIETSISPADQQRWQQMRPRLHRTPSNNRFFFKHITDSITDSLTLVTN